MNPECNQEMQVAIEDIEEIYENIPILKYTLENPSQNLNHKLKLSYVINEPTAPLPLFGGIFSTFGVEKNTNIKYYNYMDYLKQKPPITNNQNKNNINQNNFNQTNSIYNHFNNNNLNNYFYNNNNNMNNVNNNNNIYNDYNCTTTTITTTTTTTTTVEPQNINNTDVQCQDQVFTEISDIEQSEMELMTLETLRSVFLNNQR
ncbi:expressed protein [Dictyostelium purpureum]|uniref:Expressed protein n=1 Tax=Dictyostelium purpureum TaxID=5786 RepID=F0ZZT1_DICPU|nr:uncharacterized protein DICPUDRAFT_95717 [Dictyostelium purpureum]EGC30559.1 expressed protein [Dictyostelium purpureum]|eukprot:XP_003292926.1 expressed protein [Dictyostelium purpureum]